MRPLQTDRRPLWCFCAFLVLSAATVALAWMESPAAVWTMLGSMFGLFASAFGFEED